MQFNLPTLREGWVSSSRITLRRDSKASLARSMPVRVEAFSQPKHWWPSHSKWEAATEASNWRVGRLQLGSWEALTGELGVPNWGVGSPPSGEESREEDPDWGVGSPRLGSWEAPNWGVWRPQLGSWEAPTGEFGGSQLGRW